MAISKGHKRGNDGNQGSVTYARPTLPKTLENEYLAGRAAEASAKREAKVEGPKKRGPKSTLDPVLTLQARALHEYAGWTRRHVAACFEWPLWKVDQVFNYCQLAHVVPTEADVPVDKVKPVVEDKRRTRHTIEFSMPRFMASKEYDEAELRLGAQD